MFHLYVSKKPELSDWFAETVSEESLSKLPYFVDQTTRYKIVT